MLLVKLFNIPHVRTYMIDVTKLNSKKKLFFVNYCFLFVIT